MTIHCIAECGAFYTQGLHIPTVDDNLIAAGWVYTVAGWVCDECDPEKEEENVGSTDPV